MTEAPDPLRACCVACAAEYDRIDLKPERQADLRQIEAWLPAHFAGRRVLEVACGTGFWWSHVPRARLREFLQGLHACLKLSARFVFLDNRFVPGSSTPVSEAGAQGDTWQQRRLDDGSTQMGKLLLC